MKEGAKMKRSKIILSVLAVVLMMFSLISCTQQDATTSDQTNAGEGTETSEATVSETEEVDVLKVLESTIQKATKTEDDLVKVAILLSMSSHETFVNMIRHARTLEESLNCQIDEYYFESDTNKLVSGIENFTAAKEDVIIFQNVDPEATREAVAAANAAGVITVAWDVDMDICDFAYIGLQYDIGYGIGKNAADFINNELGGTAKVALYEILSIPFFVDRSKGMEDAIKELAPNAEIIGISSALDNATAYSDAENFMIMDPDINVIVGVVDNFVAQAYKAFETNGRGQSEDDLCGFFGCDCNTDGMECMTDDIENLWYGSIFMDLNTLTKSMVTTAVNARRGIMPEERIGYFSIIPVDRTNYQEYPIGE